MTTPFPTRRQALLGGLAASAASLALPGPARAQLGRPDIIIGWTPWADAEIVTKLAATVLRQSGVDTELALADIDAQFRTMAQGDIDAMLMSWEPDLHAPYLRRHGDSLVALGTLYEGTIGLAVPDWVDPALIATIEDLKRPDVREALGGRIVGIDPSAGIMATTRRAMEVYGLSEYTLEEGTGPKMVREIALAQRAGAPIVVTGWRPHAKFALYGMDYLADPEGVYSSVSRITARANAAFVDRSPEITTILGRMSFEVAEIETMLADARARGAEAAIATWISENPDRVRAWLE